MIETEPGSSKFDEISRLLFREKNIEREKGRLPFSVVVFVEKEKKCGGLLIF